MKKTFLAANDCVGIHQTKQTTPSLAPTIHRLKNILDTGDWYDSNDFNKINASVNELWSKFVIDILIKVSMVTPTIVK